MTAQRRTEVIVVEGQRIPTLLPVAQLKYARSRRHRAELPRALTVVVDESLTSTAEEAVSQWRDARRWPHFVISRSGAIAQYLDPVWDDPSILPRRLHGHGVHVVLITPYWYSNRGALNGVESIRTRVTEDRWFQRPREHSGRRYAVPSRPQIDRLCDLYVVLQRYAQATQMTSCYRVTNTRATGEYPLREAEQELKMRAYVSGVKPR